MTDLKIFEIINEKNEAERKLGIIKSELIYESNLLDFSALNDYDYETVKGLFNQIQYLIDDSKKEALSEIVESKKAQKYPQLLKPTYYPEIDLLQISDNEKLRLDKAAYVNSRYYLSEDNIGRLEIKMSIQDLERLRSIGVVEKKFSFKCKDCGDPCVTISENDIEKYKRVFYLEGLGSSLSDEQGKELDELYENGFYCISICCMDCDFDYEITNMADLDNYKPYIKEVYKVVKTPDLTYEKL